MEFKTEAQRQCYEKVKRWLQEIFGEFAYPLPDKPWILLTHGSALEIVRVDPWGKDDAKVTCRSYVVSGAEKTPELMDFLLRTNAERLMWGYLCMDSDGDILMESHLVGSTLGKDELRVVVLAILEAADEIDDEIVSRFGGLRALDRAKEALSEQK